MNKLIIKDRDIEIVTFSVDKFLYGIDILQIQEINQQVRITTVHNAPSPVIGLINLRGFVVTVIDLRLQFNLPKIDEIKNKKIIVVNNDGEYIGLLIDDIDDVLTIKASQIVTPPPNALINKNFLSGVYQSEGPLIMILNIKEMLKMD